MSEDRILEAFQQIGKIMETMKNEITRLGEEVKAVKGQQSTIEEKVKRACQIKEAGETT